MELFEKTINTSYVFKGKIINVKIDDVELPNGNKSFREIVEHNGGVCVLPIDENDNIYMVKQFRSPYKEALLEIPAGKKEGDEQPIDCGIRELKEEIGAVAKNIIPLGTMYPTPAYCGERIWIFAATNLQFEEQKLDEDEFLNVEKIPLDKAIDMVLNDELRDAKTQVAILKAKALKEQGKL